jgi:hypothetical protein
MEDQLRASGHTVDEANSDELESLWQRAKEQERPTWSKRA